MIRFRSLMLAGALVLAGCGLGGDGSKDRSTNESAESSPSAPPEGAERDRPTPRSPGDTRLTPPPGPPRPKSLDWRTVLDREDTQTRPVFDGRYLVRESRHGVVAIDTRADRTVVDHRMEPGWYVEWAYLAPPWLMLVSIEDQAEDPAGSSLDGASSGSAEPAEPAVRIHRVDLRDGRSERVAADAADPSPWSVQGGRLAFVARTPGSVSCVRVLTIESGEVAEPYCADSGQRLGWVQLHGESLTFVAAQGGDDECRTTVRVDLAPGADTAAAGRAGGASERPVLPVLPAGQSRCGSLGGVTLDGITLWVEQPSAERPFKGQVHAADPSGRHVRLGPGTPGSVRVCAGYAYWNVELFADGEPGHQIRRWRPGGSVEIVYRAPGPDLAATTTVACNNGWLSVERSYTGAGDKYEQLLAAPATS